MHGTDHRDKKATLQAYLSQCVGISFILIHSTKEKQKTTQHVKYCKVLSTGAVMPQTVWVCAELEAHVQSCLAQWEWIPACKYALL